MTPRPPRWATVTALVVGLGLASAPALFQMYDRAPLGGDMMVDFEPYMSSTKIDSFTGYLDTIDAAIAEYDALRAEAIDLGVATDADFDTTFVAVAGLADQWPTVDDDMSDLIARMDRNLDNYDDITSLPSFDLFPFFFVIPGGLMAMAAAVLLLPRRRGERAAIVALIVLGVGMVLAPVAFQMFTRAPQGAEMIDDFRPMMTVERVRDVQSYFVTLGGGESQLRASLLPAYTDAGGDPSRYPALAEFSAIWPTMLTDFNPMIATMRDNVDNFEAVDALPNFALFPWFFLAPGLVVGACGAVAWRHTRRPDGPAALITDGGNPS